MREQDELTEANGKTASTAVEDNQPVDDPIDDLSDGGASSDPKSIADRDKAGISRGLPPLPAFVPIVFRAAIAVAVLALSIGIFMALSSTAPRVAMAPETSKSISVKAMPSLNVRVNRQWSGFGTVQAVDSANVPARVSAVVKEDGIPDAVEVGKLISKGETIVELDDADFLKQETIAKRRIAEITARLKQLDIEERSANDRLELAQDDVKIAKNDLKRVLELRKKGNASQDEEDNSRRLLNTADRNRVQAEEAVNSIRWRRDQFQAQADTLQAELELTQLNKGRCTITSPITGILETVDVEVGDDVPRGKVVARVVDLALLETPLQLPAGARSKVVVGDTAKLLTSSGEEYDATVSRISPTNDPQSRTMSVFVEVAQKDAAKRFASGERVDLLTPGTFVEGVVNSHIGEVRTVVPRGAFRRNSIQVVKRDGTLASMQVDIAFEVTRRFPQTHLDFRQWIALEQTLPEGTPVLLYPSTNILDGAAVQAVYPTPKPTTQPSAATQPGTQPSTATQPTAFKQPAEKQS